MYSEPMRNYVQLTLGLPASAMAGFAASWIDGLQLWQRMVEVRIDILSHQAAFMRTNNHIARGADWMDHYGKRIRDVNVERV